jgi:ElaB/YqjD/DUF883 family membrane-anchored ribosome-binding protein
VDNERELEVIHHQMERTRASLADKLDTLENQVLGTVQDATSAVAHTVQDATSAVTNTVEDVKSAVGTVTGSIQETVQSVKETVKETFDLREHFRRHPWVMMGGSMSVGFLAGWMLSPPPRRREAPEPSSPPLQSYQSLPPREQAVSTNGAAGGPEILQKLKSMAVGTLMGVLRKMVLDVAPDNLKADLTSLVDDVTVKLGGKPASEADQQAGEEQRPSEEGAANGKRKQAESERRATAEGDRPGNTGKGDRRRSIPGRK